jgi:hypothetical protein
MTDEDRNLKVVEAYRQASNRGDVTAALVVWTDPVLNLGLGSALSSSEGSLRTLAPAKLIFTLRLKRSWRLMKT